MDKINDVPVVSATDLVAYLACGHVTWLDRLAASGAINKPERNDPMLELLQARGLDHEAAYLELLKDEGTSVVEIPDDPQSDQAQGKPDRAQALLRRDAATRQAMAEGVGVVYQATFLDQSAEPWWRGHADFLRRVDSPSDLGDWAYEPEDTKLSRHAKASAVLQLCFYAEQVERLQGTPAEAVHVILGGNERVSVRLAEVSAYYRAVRRQFLGALGVEVESYPLPCEHCAICRWAGRCHQRWDDDDHLSRVAYITGEQTRRLEAAGITTLTALAKVPEGTSIPDLSGAVVDRLRTQARLQWEREPGQPPPVEPILPVEPGMGLSGLPEPDAGDLFYDIEGHPYVGEHGLEYLHGIGWDDAGELVFDGWWAHTPAAERLVFERLIDFIVERRRHHRNMHVYHYAPYETTAIGKLMGRYGTREDEVDDLLRGGVFVDLYRVVRQGLRIGTPSYSIKKLEPLYMRPREGDIGTGGSSIVEYERWLHSQDPQILDDIEAYNRDDVESTWLLQGWLEGQRQRLIDEGTDVPRPSIPEPPEADAVAPELAVLIERLTFDKEVALDEEVEPSLEARTRWLMADLLQWHRREAKPEWWMYFERMLRFEDDDFVHDTETLGRLESVGEVGQVKRSIVWRYRFDPGQEFKLRLGDTLYDPALLRAKQHGAEGVSPGAGRVHAFDGREGTIDLIRGNRWSNRHPTSLMPGGPMNNEAMAGSLTRVAEALLAHGIDGPGPARSARQLLARAGAGDPGRGGGRAPAARRGADTRRHGPTGGRARRFVPAGAGTAGGRQDVYRGPGDPRAGGSGTQGGDHRLHPQRHRQRDQGGHRGGGGERDHGLDCPEDHERGPGVRSPVGHDLHGEPRAAQSAGFGRHRRRHELAVRP